MGCFIFAPKTGIVRFLLLRTAQCKQCRPEQNDADTGDGLVVRRCFIQTTSQLPDTRLNTLDFAAQLIAVVRLILHR